MGTIFDRSDRDREPFVPRPTDVIISPFPKCGTTWLQQMVHSLRTGGDMDFDDIYEVVPWIGIAPLLDQDLEAGAVDLETFVASQMFDVDGDDTYWAHAISWLAQRDTVQRTAVPRLDRRAARTAR